MVHFGRRDSIPLDPMVADAVNRIRRIAAKPELDHHSGSLGRAANGYGKRVGASDPTGMAYGGRIRQSAIAERLVLQWADGVFCRFVGIFPRHGPNRSAAAAITAYVVPATNIPWKLDAVESMAEPRRAGGPIEPFDPCILK